ncbi:MAG: threonine synthase [Bacteroidota bacterium]
MKFFSTNGQTPLTDWREVLFRGLAPDRGLFMPETIPSLPKEFLENLASYSLPEIGYTIARAFLSEEEISDTKLKTLVSETLDFEIPLVQLDENTYTLELFHGPTLAFKDVGARFMARLMSHFRTEKQDELVVLAATSGDTGSAVASGFYQVEGIRVILLFPKGKVSKIQEQQLTTWGGNITALEVEGTFDDCQKFVKTAFQDEELRARLTLTSANSINFGRLLPQSFYYFHALAQLPESERRKVVFSVPSGNFGHLTAGLLAERMGLPISYFIAATNSNNVVPEYLETGKFSPRPSVPTISNAMDVGNPSNFARMESLFDGDPKAMQTRMRGFWLDDEATSQELHKIYTQNQYTADPHGAIGYAALKKFLDPENEVGIFLETAHPAKFKDVVDEAIPQPVQMPERLARVMKREQNSIPLPAEWDAVKGFLMEF